MNDLRTNLFTWEMAVFSFFSLPLFDNSVWKVLWEISLIPTQARRLQICLSKTREEARRPIWTGDSFHFAGKGKEKNSGGKWPTRQIRNYKSNTQCATYWKPLIVVSFYVIGSQPVFAIKSTSKTDGMNRLFTFVSLCVLDITAKWNVTCSLVLCDLDSFLIRDIFPYFAEGKGNSKTILRLEEVRLWNWIFVLNQKKIFAQNDVSKIKLISSLYLIAIVFLALCEKTTFWKILNHPKSECMKNDDLVRVIFPVRWRLLHFIFHSKAWTDLQPVFSNAIMMRFHVVKVSLLLKSMKWMNKRSLEKRWRLSIPKLCEYFWR